MKYASLLLVAFALAGCNSSKEGVILTTAATVAYAPAEGVYPDCKFGVVAPDQGGPARCAPPAIN